MIKLGTKLVRETVAPYEYTDDNGELKTETIRVRYYSHSIAQIRDNAAKIQQEIDAAKEKDEPLWLSATLPYQLESLPDIADPKNGKGSIKITRENLELIARHNLEAIQRAITEDLAPKEQPSK